MIRGDLLRPAVLGFDPPPKKIGFSPGLITNKKSPISSMMYVSWGDAMSERL